MIATTTTTKKQQQRRVKIKEIKQEDRQVLGPCQRIKKSSGT